MTASDTCSWSVYQEWGDSGPGVRTVIAKSNGCGVGANCKVFVGDSSNNYKRANP